MALGKWKPCIVCGLKLHRANKDNSCVRCMTVQSRRERRDKQQASNKG